MKSQQPAPGPRERNRWTLLRARHAVRKETGRVKASNPARPHGHSRKAKRSKTGCQHQMDQQPLEDIRVAAQMRATHPTGVIEMREGAFDPPAPLTHQAPAARSTNPAPISIHRGLGLRLL